MRILHLSQYALSNSPANLASVQKNAEVLLGTDRTSNGHFFGGCVWSSLKADDLVQRFEAADVIHFHNTAWSQSIFNTHPHLKAVAKGKKLLIQYHSQRDVTQGIEETLKDPLFDGKRAVIAQYQVRQYPEKNFIVPNVLPISAPMLTPLQNRSYDYPCVTSSMSNAHLSGWDYKGFDVISPIFARLNTTGCCTAKVIYNQPYKEALLEKRWSHIGVEEIFTGSYHLSFLEYMSIGCATIWNPDAETLAAMQSVVGEEAVASIPAIRCQEASLENRLFGLIREPEMLRGIGLASRKWMEQYWNPINLVKHFEEIYARL